MNLCHKTLPGNWCRPGSEAFRKRPYIAPAVRLFMY